MASAPAVQNLQDIVSQYTAAQAPQSQAIDNQITANDNSGATATQGINAAENTAFQGIDQKANDSGMYFSGFRPDQQAAYVGSTYLPALANLQKSIADTRNTLLGQKAALQTSANTDALTTEQDQQKSLDAWNTQQESEAAAQRLQQEAEAANAQDTAAKNANALQVENVRSNATLGAAGIGAAKAAVSPDVAATQILAAGRGADGFVSPSTFELARKMYTAAGGSASDFAKGYWNFTGANAGQKNQGNWKSYYYG